MKLAQAALLALSSLPLAANTTAQTTPAQRSTADPTLPAYKPDPALSGKLNLIGTDTMKDLVAEWITGFHAAQPKVEVSLEAKGALTAAPALLDGSADIAPLGREMTPVEIDKFRAKYGYAPTGFRVALGSYATSGKTVALAMFVNEQNPLSHLNFAQLDAIYCTTLKRGQPAPITKWGQLGLTGEWKDRDIHLVGVKVPDGISNFMRLRLCDDGAFREGIHEENTGGTVNVLDRIVSLVAADPAAIGYAGFLNLKPGAKQLTISESASGPFLKGTFAQVASTEYPLTRYVYLFVNRAPGKPLPPLTTQFLRYVLSHAGQVAVEHDGTLMPLPRRAVEAELTALAHPPAPAPADEPVVKETLRSPIDPALPVYRPVAHLSGTLESFGSDTMDDLMQPWSAAFHKLYPDVTIHLASKASMSVPAALTAGSAQLAPLSRELNPAEIEAFRAQHGAPPRETRIALGSFRTPTRTVTLTFYVNASNPITKLDFQQLDAMWCTTRKRGAPADIVTWGQLGLKGEWAARPVHLVGVLPPDGVPNFISRTICDGGPFREGIITEKNEGNGSVLTRIVQHVADDPAAIGYAGFHNQLPNTKPVAISFKPGGPYLTGTFDEVRSARYPLTRYINLYTAPPTGSPSDEITREFLRFLLSREGQKIVEDESIFMPLPASIAAAQRETLR